MTRSAGSLFEVWKLRIQAGEDVHPTPDGINLHHQQKEALTMFAQTNKKT